LKVWTAPLLISLGSRLISITATGAALPLLTSTAPKEKRGALDSRADELRRLKGDLKRKVFGGHPGQALAGSSQGVMDESGSAYGYRKLSDDAREPG
jgi:hypothetical protein